MVQPLTKENFFNDLEKECPDAVEDFKQWIDEFKVKIGWDKIFVCNPGTGQVLKFDSIPFELQTGIIGRYIVERMCAITETGVQNYERSAGREHREHLVQMFKTVQHDLEKKKNALN